MSSETLPVDAESARDISRIHPPQRRVAFTAITTEPLDIDAHEAAVRDSRAGAVVTFSGEVRDHDHARAVARLEYEGHPNAATVLAEIVADVITRTDAEAVAVSHRIGPLAVGESAIVAAASAAHRREAFAACELIVDEVKARLPIWKHQHFTDGATEWVACP